MKRPHPVWLLTIFVLALAPAGFRMLTWRTPRPATVDSDMARAGQTLFVHDWEVKDRLANGGDGLGPVFNATSCVACHNLPRLGGAGGLDHNVTTFIVQNKGEEKPREGVVHAFGISGFQETLHQVHSGLPDQPRLSLDRLTNISGRHCDVLRFQAGVHISQRNTPALFGAKLIDEIPERDIVANERKERLKWGLAPSDNEVAPVGRAHRLADGRIGRFGWKAQTASLSDFVQNACANELGLSNPGHPQPTPLGRPEYQPVGMDLTLDQCNQLTAFVASLPRPQQIEPAETRTRAMAHHGKDVFTNIGCANCHTPDLGSAEGIYSDLLLHRMGQPLEGGGSYGQPPPEDPNSKPHDGPLADEWRTPPLWGVADSAPYLHDGRANTVEQAIELHGGQAARAAQRFAKLPNSEKVELVVFLKTLRAPK
jgi:CxxC motif-containing protein (DUF1111 family)